MKEYICLGIRNRILETQSMLNDYAETGWKLVASYGNDNAYLILERERKSGRKD